MLMLIETERVRKLYKFFANILVITVGLQFMRKLYIVLCHIVQSDIVQSDIVRSYSTIRYSTIRYSTAI